jgi:hypothetical protein
MTKRVIQISVVVLATMIVFACSFKSQNPIVGKWKDVEKAEIVEFTKEGSLLVSANGFSMSGNYKVVDEGRIQVELTGLGTEIVSVKVTGDELSVTDPQGKVSRYKRA